MGFPVSSSAQYVTVDSLYTKMINLGLENAQEQWPEFINRELSNSNETPKNEIRKVFTPKNFKK
jgi:hypothetical protein